MIKQYENFIFDSSIMKWRKQTEADKKWAKDVINESFPKKHRTNKSLSELLDRLKESSK